MPASGHALQDRRRCRPHVPVMRARTTHQASRPGLRRPSCTGTRADARAGGRQIEEGRFAELSNELVLPPVDDLRQAALYLPYALLPSDADAALAAKARRAQRGGPVITCMHSLVPLSAAAPARTAAGARQGHMPALLQGQLVPTLMICSRMVSSRLRCARGPGAICTCARACAGTVWCGKHALDC